MKASVTFAEALADPHLLGAALGPIDPTWSTWLAVGKAIFGEKMNRAERRAFEAIAGGRKPPARKVAELWAIVGRRGGKSRMAAALAAYFACFVDYHGKLAAGEVGFILVLAASRSQARTVFDYIEGFLRASPVLAELIESVTADEIRLRGNIIIGVHTNSFRTVRGRTLLACILDEVGYWRDETSATPDLEVYRALLPALATVGGPLIGISTPYRRVGLLHTKFRDCFGQDDDDVLVVRGGTEAFNPTINATIIARARKSDPLAALNEWDAEFRADIAALLDDASIDAAIDHGRPLELPPREGITYACFVDASAGRHDAFTICVTHREGDRIVADLVRGRRPPFDPATVAKEYARLARDYRCQGVTGDNFAAEWVAGAFRGASVAYQRSPLTRSELYLELLPEFMRGSVSIPNQPQLVRELRLLERRVGRNGRDSVDHPGGGGSDDYSNVLAGAVYLVAKPPAAVIVAPIVVTRSDNSAPHLGNGSWSDPMGELGGSTPSRFEDFGRGL